MARFSVGGGDDVGGSSNHRSRKRLRHRIGGREEERVQDLRDRDEEEEEEEEEEFSQHRDGENSIDETDYHREGDDDLGMRFETGVRDRRRDYSVSSGRSSHRGSDHGGDEDALMVSRRIDNDSWSMSGRAGFSEEGRTESDGERPGTSSQRSRRLRPNNYSSPLRRCCSSDRNHRDGGDAPVSVTLEDTEVLDCCVCYEPLTIPIFQCENGHIACSTCCTKLRNKCPSCSLPIGYNRCRALEKVLESARVPCPNQNYGCLEKFNYGSKLTHVKNCIHSPCSCPFDGCSYTGPSKQLYKHFSTKHREFEIGFTYGNSVSITTKWLSRKVILQENNSGELFTVQLSVESLGNVVVVRCIAPPTGLATGEFSYSLVVKTEASCLRFESQVKRVQRLDNESSLTGYAVIPSDFSDGAIRLEICIRRNSIPP